ncbi:nucleotide-binding alpha-beta plait domain-containing protein, partial [Tanacetum coccineum]
AVFGNKRLGAASGVAKHTLRVLCIARVLEGIVVSVLINLIQFCSTEIPVKTIPFASKIEVDEVRTLNMDEKRKKRGGPLIAKPDYKKAYVTFRNPLSINLDLYLICVIKEDKKNMSKQSKSTILEGGNSNTLGFMEVGFRIQPGMVAGCAMTTRVVAAPVTSKFPWTNMRSIAR